MNNEDLGKLMEKYLNNRDAIKRLNSDISKESFNLLEQIPQYQKEGKFTEDDLVLNVDGRDIAIKFRVTPDSSLVNTLMDKKEGLIQEQIKIREEFDKVDVTVKG